MSTPTRGVVVESENGGILAHGLDTRHAIFLAREAGHTAIGRTREATEADARKVPLGEAWSPPPIQFTPYERGGVLGVPRGKVEADHNVYRDALADAERRGMRLEVVDDDVFYAELHKGDA